MSEQEAAVKLADLNKKIRAMEAAGRSERTMRKVWKQIFETESHLKANYRGCR